MTENIVDFPTEHDVAIAFVLTRNLPGGRAMTAGLVDLLSAWARANADPYRGHHWPTLD